MNTRQKNKNQTGLTTAYITFELQEILRQLESEGTRAVFTDSKSQYHYSIKRVKNG